MKTTILAAVALACIVPSAASAAPIILDGVADAAYGAAQSTVAHNPSADIGNFGTPSNENASVDYSIFLKGVDGYVYGLIKAGSDGSPAGAFANLYFDLDQASAPSGSDLGFEITNLDAFIPGVAGSVATPGISFFTTANSVEFAIPVSYFTNALAGLSYNLPPGQFPAIGDSVRLNLSQSLGYSVAGGTGYGANRLGTAVLTAAPAVPEPATWAMMLAGFGVVGGAMRRRRRASGAALSGA